MSVVSLKSSVNPFTPQSGESAVQGGKGMDLLALIQGQASDPSALAGEAGAQSFLDFEQELAPLEGPPLAVGERGDSLAGHNPSQLSPALALPALQSEKGPMFAPKSPVPQQIDEMAPRKAFFPGSAESVQAQAKLQAPGPAFVSPSQTEAFTAVAGPQGGMIQPSSAPMANPRGDSAPPPHNGDNLGIEEMPLPAGAFGGERSTPAKARTLAAHKAYRQMGQEAGMGSALLGKAVDGERPQETPGPFPLKGNGQCPQRPHGLKADASQDLGLPQGPNSQAALFGGASSMPLVQQASGAQTPAQLDALRGAVLVKAENRTLNLERVAQGDANQIIDRIVAHVEANKINAQSSLDLTIKSEELGDFKLHVQKSKIHGPSGGVDIKIAAATEEGQRFFAEHEKQLLSGLSNAGVKVGDFKLVTGQAAGAHGSWQESSHDNSKERSSSQSFSHNGNGERESQSRQGQEQRDADRRQRQWDAYRERMVA